MSLRDGWGHGSACSRSQRSQDTTARSYQGMSLYLLLRPFKLVLTIWEVSNTSPNLMGDYQHTSQDLNPSSLRKSNKFQCLFEPSYQYPNLWDAWQQLTYFVPSWIDTRLIFLQHQDTHIPREMVQHLRIHNHGTSNRLLHCSHPHSTTPLPPNRLSMGQIPRRPLWQQRRFLRSNRYHQPPHWLRHHNPAHASALETAAPDSEEGGPDRDIRGRNRVRIKPKNHIIDLITPQKRHANSFLFFIYTSVCIISSLRIVALATRINDADLPYTFAYVAYWSILEPTLGNINCCLPVLQPVMSKLTSSRLWSRASTKHSSERPNNIKTNDRKIAHGTGSFKRLKDDESRYPMGAMSPSSKATAATTLPASNTGSGVRDEERWDGSFDKTTPRTEWKDDDDDEDEEALTIGDQIRVRREWEVSCAWVSSIGVETDSF